MSKDLEIKDKLEKIIKSHKSRLLRHEAMKVLEFLIDLDTIYEEVKNDK